VHGNNRYSMGPEQGSAARSGVPAGGADRAGGDELPLRPRRTVDRYWQAAGTGYVGYSTPDTCWTTRMTWQE
jgi:hypothetical protein